jgi:WxcM-like protein
VTTIDDCRIIDFPRILRPQGNLTAVQSGKELPFEIARVYYLYDVPGGATRGGHAHCDLQQVIISAMGSFCVELDDGRHQKSVRLSRAYYGLYVPQMVWRELVDFSSGGISLVLASLPYAEDEYIRDYQDFLAKKGQRDDPVS